MNIEKGLRVVIYAGVWLNRNVRGRYSTPLLGSIVSASSNRVVVEPDGDYFNRKRLQTKEFWFEDVYALGYWERGHYVDMAIFKAINPPPEPIDGQLQETVALLEKRLSLLEKKYTIILNHNSDNYAIGAVDIKPSDL